MQQPEWYDLNMDSDQATTIPAELQPEKGTKPDISLLDDAVITDENGRLRFVVEPGNKVIIERYATLLSTKPWLDTQAYTVIRVDQVTGNLELHNDEFQQYAVSNFIDGVKHGFKFKIPTKSGRVPKRRTKRAKLVAKNQRENKAVRAKQSGAPNSAPLRRIYVVRGVTHTRVKNKAYVAPSGTRCVGGDRCIVAVQDDFATISSPDNSWQERWAFDPTM